MKLPVPSSAVAFPSPIRLAALTHRRSGWERARVRVKGHGSSSAVALVITLILLSVITFMAVTFLVVSRAQKGAVGTSTDQTTAKLAADAAFERAKAELLASILAFTNPAGYDLRVSTNYINSLGFVPNNFNPTNVNYDYKHDGSRVFSQLDQWQNLANLLYDPRPPVFVVTNRLFPNSNEFRFYLDLNRNGRYDTNGLLPVIGPNGGFLDTNGISGSLGPNTASNFFVGDPEWIGGLEKAGSPHSATNRFQSRHAYIAIPAGKTLDMNYIHNQAKEFPNAALEGFLRNQGAGTYEANLAAFLVDLNTNLWPPQGSPGGLGYFYHTDLNLPSTGVAFQDALWLLRYRYQGNWKTLKRVDQLFGISGVNAFINDFVDGYVGSPLTTIPPDPDSKKATKFGWSGADNLNHFFTTQELFDKNKTSIGSPGLFGFTDRLRIAGATNDSYNRYTFYRMLAQLGTDSASEPASKMNLNYDNLTQRNPMSGTISATNFYAWEPVTFFTNAAIRLLANAGYTAGNATTNLLAPNIFGGTNIQIQIWPTNFYTPSIHRLLQLAANIYDASTNRNPVIAGTNLLALPSVFRPVFQKIRSEWYITGYTEVTNSQDVLTARPIDLSNPDLQIKPRENVIFSGIPLVIGAKKGLPNFNEFEMQTLVSVTRKLEFIRTSPFTDKFRGETNQMYVVGISNVFGVEGWNSYSSPYTRSLQMIVAVDMQALVTNEFNQVLTTNRNSFVSLLNTNFAPRGIFGTNIVIAANTGWRGFIDPTHAQSSFKVPLATSFLFLTNSQYSQLGRRFDPATGLFERNQSPRFVVPHWWLTLRSRVRFILVDTATSPNRIVDYANLDSTGDPVDLTYEPMRDGACGDPYHPDGGPGSMWCTNRGTGVVDQSVPTYGVRNQIGVGMKEMDPQNWINPRYEYPPGVNQQGAINFFRFNLAGLSPFPGTYAGPIYLTNRFYAPYEVTRNIYVYTSWQANDPLVHYMVNDLRNLVQTNNVERDTTVNSTIHNLGQINDRYEPWTGTLTAHSASPTLYDLRLKDPLVSRSDDWDFMTNKFPNIAWLGRVHRGTPWQTVYLKAPITDVLTWATWTGNGQTVTNFGQIATNLVPLYAGALDAAFTHPTNDWHILDLFTTAFNDNAARGKLSVNQTGLAGWSAILSGVMAVTNSVSDADLASNPFIVPQFTNWIIQPAGVYNPKFPTPLARIVQAINDKRGDTNLFPQRVFTRLGDILSVPELTVGPAPQYVGAAYPNGYWVGASPFLNLGNTNQVKARHPATGADGFTTQQVRGLNDAAYERIPQQILGLLKGDEQPRFVIYSFGQALKPADHSLVTSGPYFGLCTNYQVVAEVATRAVVRIEGAPDNPRAVVESYNVLPPD